MNLVLDLAVGVLVILAAVLSLAAAVGLVRFPDALSRLHAGAKPQTLGLLLMIVAIALTVREWATLLMLLPVLVFQLLTAPISAHMIGRAGYRTGNYRPELLVVDELADDIERATDAEERTAHQEALIAERASNGDGDDVGERPAHDAGAEAVEHRES